MCSFGGVLVPGAFDGLEKVVHCVSPASDAPGPVEFMMALDGQTFTKSPLDFTYYEIPENMVPTPARGPIEGGTLIQLQLKMHPPPGPRVKFRRTVNAVSPVVSNTPTISALSLIMGNTGKPIFYYVDTDNDAMWLGICSDKICSSATTSKLWPYPPGPSAFLLDGKGFPNVVFYSSETTYLTLLSCLDVNCGQPAVNNILFQWAKMPSAALGVDTFIFIAYSGPDEEFMSLNSALKCIHCDSYTCDKSTKKQLVQGRDETDILSSVVIGSDGFPVILFTQTNWVGLVHCLSSSCEYFTSMTIEEDNTAQFAEPHIRIGADGMPLMSYYHADMDTTSGGVAIVKRGYLRIVHCKTYDCAHRSPAVNFDYASGDVGRYHSLVVDKGGWPIITYYDTRFKLLKAGYCEDVTCERSTTVNLDTSSQNVGEFCSAMAGPVDSAIVAYWDRELNQIKVAHCMDPENGFCPTVVEASPVLPAPKEYTTMVAKTPPTTAAGQAPIEVALNGQQFVPANDTFFYYDVELPSLRPNSGPVCGETLVEVSLTGMDNINDTQINGIFTRNTTVLSKMREGNRIFSTVLDNDGHAIVAYLPGASTGKVVNLARCVNTDCTLFDTIKLVETSTPVNDFLALDIVVGGDGLLTIAYIEGEWLGIGELRVLHCGDSTCSTFNITRVDVKGATSSAAVALGPDKLPVISYYQCVTDRVKHKCVSGGLGLAICHNADCSSNTKVTLIPDTQCGRTSKIAVHGDDVYVVFTNYTDYSLVHLHCNLSDGCSTHNVTTIDNPISLLSQDPMLDVTANSRGHAVFSYVESPSFVSSLVKIVDCNDVDCSMEHRTMTITESQSDVVNGTTIALSTDGFPLVGYPQLDARSDQVHLKIVHCEDYACNNRTYSLQTRSDGQWPQLAVGNHSLGFVTYVTQSFDLRISYCVRAHGCETTVHGKLKTKDTAYLTTPTSAGPRVALVSVSFNGQQYTDVQMNYTYYDYEIFEISPKEGRNDGFAVITIRGSGFVDTGTVYVRYGESKRIVQAAVRSSNIIEAPTMLMEESGMYQVYLTLNEQDFDLAGCFHFKSTDHQGPTYGVLFTYVGVGLIVLLALVGAGLRLRRYVPHSSHLQFNEDIYSPLLVSAGEKLDPKEIVFIQRIGGGSYSEVHEAQYRGRTVAVKKLYIKKLQKENLREFEMECSLLSRLSHPNVLQYIGAISKPACLVTEYCPRGSLHHILHQGPPLSWELIVSMMADVCRGVDYLHSCTPKIIHRDLKSANLLVTDDWRVKVGDFGLSRVFETEQTMTVVGTPAWAAPEVLRHQHYTEKADVYSFGIVMWEMMTHADPFPGMSSAQVIMAVIEKKMRPEILPFFPEPMSTLMTECWDEDPKMRPTFSNALERLTAMQPAAWTCPGDSAYMDWWMTE
eukprot:GFYU01003828.1.p1 GENE.GFYU01003828.1~~GFYU01003828.1.p1  ORF type:complete len:1602 (+),score=333.76 GFYU01003828.1:601-4806(+)